MRFAVAALVGCALAVAGSGAALPPAPAGSNPLVATLPETYLADAAKEKSCKDGLEPPWLSFLSYAQISVGDEWRVMASSRALCALADTTYHQLLDYLPGDGGAPASPSIVKMQLYAILVGRGTTDYPIGKHVPAGWKCFALPSVWGAMAWENARLDHAGVPSGKEFATASGPAAGAGYCLSGSTLDARGRWHGGRFFWWAPDTLRCRRGYKLKEIPDPANPGQTTNPPYPSALFGDYDTTGC